MAHFRIIVSGLRWLPLLLLVNHGTLPYRLLIALRMRLLPTPVEWLFNCDAMVTLPAVGMQLRWKEQDAGCGNPPDNQIWLTAITTGQCPHCGICCRRCCGCLQLAPEGLN